MNIETRSEFVNYKKIVEKKESKSNLDDLKYACSLKNFDFKLELVEFILQQKVIPTHECFNILIKDEEIFIDDYDDYIKSTTSIIKLLVRHELILTSEDKKILKYKNIKI
jgi:hypothetical protein